MYGGGFRLLFIDFIFVGFELLQLEDILLSEDVVLQLLPLALGAVVEGVFLEDVQPFLTIDGLVEVELVRELVLELHQIEFRNDSGMVLEACLPNRKQVLYGVLHAGLNLAFVEEVLEHFEDGVGAAGCEL